MVNTYKHGIVTQCKMSSPHYKDGKAISARIEYTKQTSQNYTKQGGWEKTSQNLYTVYAGGYYLCAYYDREKAQSRYNEYISACRTLGFEKEDI